MSFMVDKRGEDNHTHTREEYGSVKNLFSIFSRVHLKSVQFITLKAFKQLERNEN